MRLKPNNKGTVQTFVTINGSEHDVSCDWRWNDDELEVENAMFEDEGCLLDKLDDDEYEQLRLRIQDEVAGYGDPRDDYGDWLHDCRRDERLTG